MCGWMEWWSTMCFSNRVWKRLKPRKKAYKPFFMDCIYTLMSVFMIIFTINGGVFTVATVRM